MWRVLIGGVRIRVAGCHWDFLTGIIPVGGIAGVVAPGLSCGAMGWWCMGCGRILGAWDGVGPWLVLLGWVEGVASLGGGCWDCLLWSVGYCAGLGFVGVTVGFTIRVFFWWLRLLSTSRGGVVVAVRGFRCGA